MVDDMEKYSHSGWGSMKSVSTASHFNPEEYPVFNLNSVFYTLAPSRVSRVSRAVAVYEFL